MRRKNLKHNEGVWEDMAHKAKYNAANLARFYGISKRQLEREFQRQLGCSPQSWLDKQRILAAKPLLLSGRLIKQVASELGFKQTSHFCRQFKFHNEMTPSEFIHSASPNASCRSQITDVAQG
jgi:AraC-like DNA-binding protein